MYVNDGQGGGSLVDHNGRPFDPEAVNRVGGFAGIGYGDQFPLPHITTFSQIIMSGNATYLHSRYDEALRYTRESALVMKRDCFLTSLLNERKHAVASIPWELEIPDEKDEVQKTVRDALRMALENISDLRHIIWSLLDAIWYGRQAVEIEWGWTRIRGRKIMTVLDWIPINGDKLGWTFDAIPYVLVNAGVVHEQRGAKLVNTTAGGRGLLLAGTWRDHFLIHRHERRDGDYFDGESAAGVWGVGIRSDIFWLDWIRRNYLEWITTFLERVGLGVTLWYYEGSNPAALAAVQDAAQKQSRRANLFIPVFSDGKNKQKGLVERLEVPVNGVDALRMLKEDIEQKIERYVVGQEASSKSAGSKGLGNEAGAEFQHETKGAIASWDAGNFAEMFTGNARNPGLIYQMQLHSFPDTMPDKPNGFRVKFKFSGEGQDPEKKLKAIGTVVSFNIPVRADDARKAAGLTKPDVGDEVIEMQPAQQPGLPPGQQPPPGAEEAPPNGEGGPEAGGDNGEFKPPYPGGDEGVDDIMGPDAEAQLMRRRTSPLQYVSVPRVAADMIARRQNAAPTLPNKPPPAGWTVYHGPHGGVGWKNSKDGKVIYATSGRSPFKNKGGGQQQAGGQGGAQQQQTVVRRRLNAMALGRWYADHWNLLADLGMQPSRAEKHEAGLELYGSGVSLWHDQEGDGHWQVIRLDKEDIRAPQQYAFNPDQARVPAGKGPIIIAGRPFEGGEWVPEEFESQATPAQKAMLHEAHTGSAEKKLASGPANTVQMHVMTAPHREENPLEGHQLRHARQTYKALMRHHGELLMHRIQELTSDTQRVLESLPEGDEVAPIREKFKERMAAYGHMLDWAKENGMTPEEEPSPVEPHEKYHGLLDQAKKVRRGAIKDLQAKASGYFNDATSNVHILQDLSDNIHPGPEDTPFEKAYIDLDSAKMEYDHEGSAREKFDQLSEIEYAADQALKELPRAPRDTEHEDGLTKEQMAENKDRLRNISTLAGSAKLKLREYIKHRRKMKELQEVFRNKPAASEEAQKELETPAKENGMTPEEEPELQATPPPEPPSLAGTMHKNYEAAQSPEVTKAAADFRNLLDGIGSGTSGASIDEFMANAGAMSKDALEALKSKLNLQGKSKNKTDALGAIKQVLDSQYEMWIRTHPDAPRILEERRAAEQAKTQAPSLAAEMQKSYEEADAAAGQVEKLYKEAISPNTTLEAIEAAVDKLATANMSRHKLEELGRKVGVSRKLPTKMDIIKAIRQNILSIKGTWDRKDA